MMCNPDHYSDIHHSNFASHHHPDEQQHQVIQRVESFQEDEDEIEKEGHLTVPHLMMTYSSDDDEEDFDQEEELYPSTSDLSSSQSCVESSNSSSSMSHLAKYPSYVSSPHFSSLSSPRHHYRQDDTNYPSSVATTHKSRQRQRIRKTQHVHRTERRDHRRIKSNPVKMEEQKLRLQRSWHGGYDYSPTSIGCHTMRKKHKRCYSYNDAFVEPLEKNLGREHVKLDSFNNIEEIFYNHYKNHPTSMSVSVDQRLHCDYPLQDQISGTHPLWRDESNSSNDIHSTSLDGDEHHSCSSSTNSYVRCQGVCHLRPILEPEMSEVRFIDFKMLSLL